MVFGLAFVASTCRIADLVKPLDSGTLAVLPLAVLDSAQAGSTAPHTRSVTIHGSDSVEAVTWSVRVALASPWLKLPATSGHAPGTFAVSFDPTGLAPGTYTDTLIFSITGPAAVPIAVPVQFRITGCAITDVSTGFSASDSLTAFACAAPGR